MATYRVHRNALNLSSLEMRILVSLLVGPMTGYEVAQQAELDFGEQSGSLSRGAIYPATRKLEQYGVIEKYDSDISKRQVYQISRFGREVLALELGRQQTLIQLGRERIIKSG
jgi:DNA-binding PadR family transcriptional regulator